MKAGMGMRHRERDVARRGFRGPCQIDDRRETVGIAFIFIRHTSFQTGRYRLVRILQKSPSQVSSSPRKSVHASPL